MDELCPAPRIGLGQQSIAHALVVHEREADELEKRVWEHQEGIFPGFTSRRRPVELVWACDCPTRDEAKETEQRVKAWSRRKKEALIRGDWAELKRASRGKHAWERRSGR